MLQDLNSVSLPQQLSTNKTASALLGSRFPVKISDAALQLALAYLQHTRLLLLLNIINTRIKFLVLDTAPGSNANADDAEDDDDMFAAAVGGDAANINRAVLQLGLLHVRFNHLFCCCCCSGCCWQWCACYVAPHQLRFAAEQLGGRVCGAAAAG